MEAYQGARDLESLFQFVMDQLAASEGQPKKEEEEEEVKRATEEEEGGEGEAGPVEKDEHGLLHLTDETFVSVISEREGVQFVKFYAPWLVSMYSNSVW